MNAKNQKIKRLIITQDLNYVFNFGKHKGKTIGEIAIADKKYLDWFKSTITKAEYNENGFKSGICDVLMFLNNDFNKKINKYKTEKLS